MPNDARLGLLVGVGVVLTVAVVFFRKEPPAAAVAAVTPPAAVAEGTPALPPLPVAATPPPAGLTVSRTVSRTAPAKEVPAVEEPPAWMVP